MSAILEQPDDAGAFHPVAFESRKLTQPKRSYPPHLLSVVHALKALRPYLLDRLFELNTDKASLLRLQQQHHVSHHQARWLNLLAEYQTSVVHIPGHTNPADFLTEALPQRLRRSAAHGLRRPGFALALDRIWRGPRFRLRGRWSLCRLAPLPARRFRGRYSRGAPI